MPIDEHKIKQINERSDYFQDILDKVPSTILSTGSTIMLIIFVLLAIGMRIIKYPDVIVTEGVVTTENPPIELHARSSGMIANLLKKNQEFVKAGDWIIVLRNSGDYNSMSRLIASLKNVSQDNFWLATDTMLLDHAANLGEVQQVYSQFCKSVEELRLFEELKSEHFQLDINVARAKNIDLLKKHQSNQLAILERQHAISKIDFDRYYKLDSTRVIASADFEQKEVAYLNTRNNLEQSRINLVNIQLQEEALNKENIVLRKELEGSHHTLRRSVLLNYNNLMFELSEWRNRYVIEAPISGVINLYEVRSTDQFLSAEQKVVTITPNVSQEYFAIAKLPVANSGKVKVGHKCIIMLNNYPYTEFGILQGRVHSVTATAQEGFYSVKVDLPKQLMTNLNRPLQNRGELTGQVQIVLDDLSLFDRLFNSLISKTY